MKNEDSMIPLLFSGLGEEAENALKSAGRLRKWHRGDLIVSEGDECKGLFLLMAGSAAEQKYTPAGDYSTICLLHPGDCFGEELLYSEENKYASALEAVSEVEILCVPTEQLLCLMESFPEIRENFHQVIAKRFRSLKQMITILSQKTVRQKIAYYLLTLAEEQGGDRVVLPVSKEVISKLLAIPRPSFSRELSLMEAEGRISISARTIGIADMPSLKKDIGEV